jgi:ribosome-associated heat shock protein Hsp15
MKQRESKSGGSSAAESAGVRLDVWLWATRFFKTRALAKQAIEGGKVQVNDAAGKPSRSVHVGDRLKVARGEDRYEIEVGALASRRGSAAVAQRCYRETNASRAAREAAAEQRRFAAAGYSKPATKPDKRARRLIRALGDIDAL